MKAKVIVMPVGLKSVLDPQGVAVRDAIHHAGMPAVSAVRVGKFLEIEFESGDETQLRAVQKSRRCSNRVIEAISTLEIAALSPARSVL